MSLKSHFIPAALLAIATLTSATATAQDAILGPTDTETETTAQQENCIPFYLADTTITNDDYCAAEGISRLLPVMDNHIESKMSHGEPFDPSLIKRFQTALNPFNIPLTIDGKFGKETADTLLIALEYVAQITDFSPKHYPNLMQYTFSVLPTNHNDVFADNVTEIQGDIWKQKNQHVQAAEDSVLKCIQHFKREIQEERNHAPGITLDEAFEYICQDPLSYLRAVRKEIDFQYYDNLDSRIKTLLNGHPWRQPFPYKK